MQRMTVKQVMDKADSCAIFRRIACVGDSLSSGELVSVSPEGKYQYNDIFEYSWANFIGRRIGASIESFSRGGMTAIEYTDSFAEANGMWDEAKKCQAYLIALGANDLYGRKMEIGSISDVNPDDPEQNKPTFAGYYAKIIQRYRKIQPRAMFFLITLPSKERTDEDRMKAEAHRELLYAFAKLFPDTFVIDLYRDAPLYDKAFKELYMMNGHMTPAGYLFSAQVILKLWNKIIDEAPERFHDVGFIGTDLYSKR